MKKKIFSILLATILVLFSFYFTAKSEDIVKNIDPIMNQINNNLEKFTVPPINAIIKEDTIIPGLKGKTVDKNLSFSKMKKYGTYNESLTTIKEVLPKISISKNFDKYIISANKNKRAVSLVFKIDSLSNLEIIKNYLDSENVSATLLIDSSLLEGNEEVLNKLLNYELELNFEQISDISISQYSNYLDSITNSKNKYCITEEKNSKLLKICKRYKMHTVIPNITLNHNPSLKIKKQLANGSIILINLNEEMKKELDYIIYYIKSKGYDIVRLDNILKE